MKEKEAEKYVGGCLILIVLVILAFLGLLAWGFVEGVQWVTSK